MSTLRYLRRRDMDSTGSVGAGQPLRRVGTANSSFKLPKVEPWVEVVVRNATRTRLLCWSLVWHGVAFMCLGSQPVSSSAGHIQPQMIISKGVKLGSMRQLAFAGIEMAKFANIRRQLACLLAQRESVVEAVGGVAWSALIERRGMQLACSVSFQRRRVFGERPPVAGG